MLVHHYVDLNEERGPKNYLNTTKVVICERLRVCPHRAKANVKAKKIKEQSREIKEQMANIKAIFRFRLV